MVGKFNQMAHRVGDTAGAANNSNIVQKVFSITNSSSEKSGRFNVYEIKLDEITPRSINKYSQSRINRLAKSIKATNNRLIHPIILVKACDLPEDSEVIKSFKEQGVDIASLKYVIVAGERRFKAWKLLRGEEELTVQKKKEAGLLGISNSFDTITANVLTKTEALNESIYYEDSNVESRSLTPNEALSHIKQAFDEIKTFQDKRQVLIEMSENTENPLTEESLPMDEKYINSIFNAANYFKWYLEVELGIFGWSDSKIKQYQAIVKKCIPKVVDAVIEEKISISDARSMTVFDKALQAKLLEFLLSGDKESFIQAISQRAKKTRIVNVDAKKKIKHITYSLAKERDALKDIIEKLGENDKKIGNNLIMQMDSLISKLSEATESFK